MDKRHEEIIARMEEAGKAFLTFQTDGRSGPVGFSALSIIQAALESCDLKSLSAVHSPEPSAEQAARMQEALGWIGLIPLDRYVLRRIVGARSLVHPTTGQHLFPWRRLGAALGADHKAIKRWHGQAIECIADALAVKREAA